MQANQRTKPALFVKDKAAFVNTARGVLGPISIGQIADALGVNRGNFSSFLNRRRPVTIPFAHAAMTALGQPADELFDVIAAATPQTIEAATARAEVYTAIVNELRRAA
jgi:transcriptional regulator with XRE-family HTH domain